MHITYEVEPGRYWAIGSTPDGRHQLHYTNGGAGHEAVIPRPLLVVEDGKLFTGRGGEPVPLVGLRELLRAAGMEDQLR